MALYAGMDTSGYPGLAAMTAAWNLSNLFWTGLYLDSPAPVPGELPSSKPLNGHNRMGGIGANPAGSWMSAWSEIRPLGWGILPIYWGQQDPANADGPTDLREIIATANAKDAADKAAAAGVPVGSVIYLDWEIGGAPSAAGVAYCRRFFQQLAELGYRPGVYCHPPASMALRKECPGLFVWNVNLATASPTDLTVASGRLILRTPSMNEPGEAPDPDAIARQWRFNLTSPAGSPAPTLPQIDADVSVVQDPAFPERQNQPMEIRGGGVTITAESTDWIAAYAVRRGNIARVTWSPTAATFDADLNTSGRARWFNPFSPTASVRIADVGPTDFFFGLDFAEANDGVWEIQVAEHSAGGAWQLTTIPQMLGQQIDPLPGVIAARRSALALEAFVVELNSRLIFGTERSAAGSWSTLHRIDSPLGAATNPLRVTNRPCAISRSAGLMDLFWIADDGLLYTTFSISPGVWSPPFAVGDPNVRAHPHANLAIVSRDSGSIDVFFIGKRDSETKFKLFNTWWNIVSFWGTPPHTQEIGGTAVEPEPLGTIAATSRTAAFIDVFVVGRDGALYNTYWNGATSAWTAFRRIGGTSRTPLAGVAGAACRGGNDVEVVAVNREGTVCASHWDNTLADYTNLERITVLDLS